MTDREKVLNGLECCSKYTGNECNNCPYDSVCKPKKGGRNPLMLDAIAQLTPRVLREGEVCDNSNRRTPMWLEMNGTLEEHSGFWVFPKSFDHWCDVMIFIPSVGEDSIGLSVFKYGKEWRCWTSSPTDAQRESVPWLKKEET